MLEAIAKFLDLLKASGWQTCMIALAAGLFLYLSRAGNLPALDPPWIEIVVYAIMFVCGALALASLGLLVQRGVLAAWAPFQRRIAKARARRAFINDIPFLSDKERQILGYLREKKQRTFEVDRAGGHASTLLGKRYIYFIGQPGQAFDETRMPVAVAEHVWDVIQERPKDFPYRPEFSSESRGQEVEVHPWRINWMAR